MIRRSLGTMILILTGCVFLQAGTIDGNVIIQHKLTRRIVTPTVSLYERGASVQLGSTPEVDPLAYERTHVVIYLEGHLASKPVPGEMKQENRQLFPDLVLVSVGSTVWFPNMDPIFHNVFSLSKAKSFDLGNYPQGHARTVTFPKPGIVVVGCHLHSNMAAVIVVAPNEFATRADRNGHFELTGVPAGTYTIVAWHKAAGFFRKKIEVSEKYKTSVDFDIPIKADDPVQEARQ
ncbi:MAG: hypothetical protein ACRD4Y_08455 [Candidatus Acidiferrales bacterium]